jgi:hypothetical protein
VPTDDNIEIAKDLAKSFIDDERFAGILFDDFLIHNKVRMNKFPAGYCIGLSIIYADVKWNIDITIMSQEENNNQKAHNFRKYFSGRCTEETRGEILMCKSWLMMNGEHYNTASLYDLFIQGELKSFNELREGFTNGKIAL